MLFSPQTADGRAPGWSDLLSRIPLSARTVLYVGCGDGSLAASYRLRNPTARLLGIDTDPSATARAAAHMEAVATADVETDPLPFDLPDGVDCIVYADILEYLHDPWGLVRRQAEVLRPDGMMLICAANVDYWRVTEHRMRGSGHKPHHAFSLDQTRDNLIEAGLSLCDVTPLVPDADAAALFTAALGPGLVGLGIDPAEYTKRASVSHLIWRVRKQPGTRMMVSGSMLDPVGGVSHMRVVYPMQALGTDPMVLPNVTNQVKPGPEDGTARLFVLHRPALFGESGAATLQRIANAGHLAITEFDDLPDRFEMMKMGGELSFYGVHAVQTSTIAMADALRPYNPEIAVFPNAIVSLPEVANFSDPGCLTLFFGALNREDDWLPLMPALNVVAGMAGERLKFQVVHDRGFFDALETPHKTFTPLCDHETYMRLVGRSEISFMPLSDTPFNRAKSDLKFIEAAACRTVALASSVVYGDSIEDGRTGMLFRDPVEFHARLLRLVAMPELARGVADAARRYVAEERMLAYQVAPRIAWYRSLWERRDALEAGRQERLDRFAADRHGSSSSGP